MDVGEGLLVRRMRLARGWRAELLVSRSDGLSRVENATWIGIELWQYEGMAQYEAVLRSDDGSLAGHVGDHDTLDGALNALAEKGGLRDWEVVEIPLKHEEGGAAPEWNE